MHNFNLVGLLHRLLGHNERVAGAIDIVSHVVTLLLGVVISMAREFIVLAIQWCFGVVVGAFTFIQYVCDVLDFNQFDFWVSVFLVCFCTASTYYALCGIWKLYKAVYMKVYTISPELANIHFSRKDVLLDLTEPKVLTTESPLSDEFIYKIPDGYPKGVFVVFLKQGDEFFHNGHGFVAGNRMWITGHQAVKHLKNSDDTKVYISSPKQVSVMVAAEIDSEPNEDLSGFDIIEIKSKGACAVLGLKTLKWRRYTENSAVTVLHYDAFKNLYTQQYVNAKRLDENDRADYILHKSMTSQGDSGLPLLQKGEVVAIHLGWMHGPDGKPLYNRSQIPFPILEEMYSQARQYDEVIINRLAEFVEPVSETPDIKVDYEKRYQEWKNKKEKDKQKRMKGEHADDQGYREGKKSRGADKPELNTDDVDDERVQKDKKFNSKFVGLSEREIAKELVKQRIKGQWADVTSDDDDEDSTDETNSKKKRTQKEALIEVAEDDIIGDLLEASAKPAVVPDKEPPKKVLKEPRSESRTANKTASPKNESKTLNQGSEVKPTLKANTSDTPTKELNPELLQVVDQFSKLLASKAELGELQKCLNKLKSLPSLKENSKKKQ